MKKAGIPFGSLEPPTHTGNLFDEEDAVTLGEMKERAEQLMLKRFH